MRAGTTMLAAICFVGCFDVRMRRRNRNAIATRSQARSLPPSFFTPTRRMAQSIVSLQHIHLRRHHLLHSRRNHADQQPRRSIEAPFLVASNLTVKAIAADAGVHQQQRRQSEPSRPTFLPARWSGPTSSPTPSGANAATQPEVWTYDTGNSGFGNHELENYCAWGSTRRRAPRQTQAPTSGTDGYLHIAAQQPSPGVYTSARLKSQGLFSFQYGRIEFRALVPEAQGLWPAAWLLGNNIVTVDWPACGEMDVLERVNAAKDARLE